MAKTPKPNKKYKRTVPKTVQDSIPIYRVYENGVIETSPGVYTKMYPINEVNFKLAPFETQKDIFLDYGSILNSFDPKVSFQVVIQNKASSEVDTMGNIHFQPEYNSELTPEENKALNSLRHDMNELLVRKLLEGKNNVDQQKYLITSVNMEDADNASMALGKMDERVDSLFRKINMDTETKPCTLNERLHSLWSIYNQDPSSKFMNIEDPVTHEKKFDMKLVRKLGMSVKDVIGPSGMEIKSSYFKLDEFYGKALYMESVPSMLSTDYISDLSDIACNLIISINYRQADPQKSIQVVKNMMLAIDGQIADQQKNASRNGYTIDLINPELEAKRNSVRDLMNDIIGRDQKMFFVTVTVLVFGKTKEEMEQNAKSVMEVSGNYLAPLRPLFFQQEEGLNTTLPLCLNQVSTSKMLTTESASVFIPYTTQELHQKYGVFYGLNAISNNMIFYDRLTGNNYNSLIFGESGNGKSFLAKHEMVSILLRNKKAKVYVIDPESEYTKLAKKMGGEVINLSAGSGSYVNPLDMDIDYGREQNPVASKIDYIISLVEIMYGGGYVISPEEKSILTRCVKNIYAPYLAHINNRRKYDDTITEDREAVPTLNSLYEELMSQTEPAAHSLATIIEMYAKGDQAFFSHRSNIDSDKKFVVYDIKNLGTGTKNIGLHVCLNDIWNKVLKNSREGIYSFFYIDEFYLLLQSPSATKFLMEMWKRSRKWKGCPTGIMQNTEDLLKNQDARNIINNTSFILSLSLKAIDRLNLKDLLGLSDQQISYIDNKGRGRGIISTGKTTLPFELDFPKDLSLYEYMESEAK